MVRGRRWCDSSSFDVAEKQVMSGSVCVICRMVVVALSATTSLETFL